MRILGLVEGAPQHSETGERATGLNSVVHFPFQQTFHSPDQNLGCDRVPVAEAVPDSGNEGVDSLRCDDNVTSNRCTQCYLFCRIGWDQFPSTVCRRPTATVHD